MRNISLSLMVLILIALNSCNKVDKSKSKNTNTLTAFNNPPNWAKEAIWYEIAVERFYNGDISNDPSSKYMKDAYPGYIPKDWKITPWTQDWYKEDDYFSSLDQAKDFYGNSIEKFEQKAILRRYGGDLQGVLNKIDYIDSLGVTAIYFRPLNDSPSHHKYDARNWRHIDRNFGPNPEKDTQIINAETPDSPETWQWTEADKLFLKVITALHEKKIKVILDYSWNHTGKSFWAWQDILKNQSNSKFKDWYWVENFDDPKTPENEFEYHGWAKIHELPEIKETKKQDFTNGLQSFEGNIYNPEAKKHILNVAKRWLDPNNDGNPSDGIDGYRLDVAAETPLGFWRDFRKHVRSINPNAYLLGEIWWEEWPDKLLDPEPYLKGDVFDAVMNYRWYRSVRSFLSNTSNNIKTPALIDSLNLYRNNLRPLNNYVMMNLTGSFDTPRVLTSLYNDNKYKFNCKTSENPTYKIHKPNNETLNKLKLLLAHQYTYIGAPHIWAGDEMEMWGADDPSTRKPLTWPEFEFDDEIVHPLEMDKPKDQIYFNKKLFKYYQKLIKIRKDNPVLSHGEIKFISLSHSNKTLCYSRHNNNNEIITIINAENSVINTKIKVKFNKPYFDILNNVKVLQKDTIIELKIQPQSAIILKSK